MEPNPYYSIYAVRCKENGRVYIGCTTDVQRRIYQHFRELINNQKMKTSSEKRLVSGELWQNDFNVFGPDAFEAFVLEEKVLIRDKRLKEEKWIEKYQSRDPKYGYNIRSSISQTFPIVDGIPPFPNVVDERDRSDSA